VLQDDIVMPGASLDASIIFSLAFCLEHLKVERLVTGVLASRLPNNLVVQYQSVSSINHRFDSSRLTPLCLNILDCFNLTITTPQQISRASDVFKWGLIIELDIYAKTLILECWH
jgi:hypothetical protein